MISACEHNVIYVRNMSTFTTSLFSVLDEWKTEIKTNGGAVQDYTISLQNLDPTTTYYFRVIAYNEFGISIPCTTEETVSDLSTLSKHAKLKILSK